MKHKKTSTSVAFLLLVLGGVNAQEALPASGGDASGSGGSASYSIGQAVYSSQTGSEGSVLQGVQQPYEISTTVGIEKTEISLNLSTYPNPATDRLTLNIDNYSKEALIFQLYDLNGKVLATEKITDNISEIDMQAFPAGTYLLNVMNNKELIKTFRILKN
ncbi:MAG: T9SS type A sorting domain-containing protein [Flavobacteriales bacterium]|jgi:hypothetical protein|nr:T9SS type A sorting domain-containing protein [Flavobacteriales bacterium]